MVRLGDWEQRLHEYLEPLADAEFAWGSLDCAMFAAGAVLAITGDDPIPEFRGRYSTKSGATRALKRYGAGTLEATVAAKFEDRPLAFARRGDLVMSDENLGVCVGADALFIGEDGGQPGLIRLPRAAWMRCWSVG